MAHTHTHQLFYLCVWRHGREGREPEALVGRGEPRDEGGEHGVERLPGHVAEDLVPEEEEPHGLALEQLPAVARVEQLGHEATHRVILPFPAQVLGQIKQNLKKKKCMIK